MNDKSYLLNFDSYQHCLSLSYHQHIVRKWYGSFADAICNHLLQSIKSQKHYALNKKQVQTFFVDVTCLHQQAMHYFGIEKGLFEANFSSQNINIAKALLLHIRMNDQHPSRDMLIEF